MRRLFITLLVATPLAAQEGAWPVAERAALQPGINAAIDGGVRALIQLQNRDGSFGTPGLYWRAHWDRRNAETAFVTYTLLKCKLPPSHPSIRRALAYLYEGEPYRTYSTTCQMMALEATKDPAHEERIEYLLEVLLDLQNRPTRSWSYPGHGTYKHDLSNTQYAALGLRAAQRAGVKVPKKVWAELLESVLRHQDVPEHDDVAHPARAGGFGYQQGDRNGRLGDGHPPSCSLTAAGLSIVGLCIEGLGGLRGKQSRAVALAGESGLAYLARNFTVESNPGGPNAWLYYYLYGLERVGALLDVTTIGEHDWYWEGARFLVEKQHDDGTWHTGGDQEWPPKPMVLGNTCFSLLFLTKATAPTSGGGERGSSWKVDGPDAPVWVTASGNGTMSFWIAGFGDDVRKRAEHAGGLVQGLRIEGVEYLVDDVVVAKLEGDVTRSWENERFPHRHFYSTAGMHSVVARVTFMKPDVTEDDVERSIVVESTPLDVLVDDLLEPWMLPYATAATTTSLGVRRVTARASSRLTDRFDATQAFDGIQFTAWISAEDDDAPTLAFKLDRGVRADRILLSSLDANPAAAGAHARPLRVALRLNGEERVVEHALSADPRVKSELAFARPVVVRSVELVVLERAEGTSAATGFAEVELGLR